MPRRERAWQRWMVELATAGRVADAIEVGAEAIEAIGASPQRAHLADQYSGYQRRSGDHRGALTTGLVAFSDDPSLDRLRQLLDDADAADQPAPIDALRATAGSDPLVHVSVRLLAGLVDDVPRADERDRMHVSTGLDAPAVAIAALLRTSTSASGRHLRLCDARVGTLDRSFAFRDAMFELERDEEIEPDPEPSPLAPRVIKALESVTVDHDRLGVAAALLDAVAAEVMSNKWRSSYALVAQLVVALAHTNEAAGQGAAADVIAGYDRTYRRFAAFRKELLQAAKVI